MIPTMHPTILLAGLHRVRRSLLLPVGAEKRPDILYMLRAAFLLPAVPILVTLPLIDAFVADINYPTVWM